MTPDQQKEWEGLQQRQALLSGRLQQIADAMGQMAIRRDRGVTRADDLQVDAANVRAWEATMARIEQVTDEQERLLQDAGILNKKEQG
jgi:hypothetical protein